MPFTSLGLSPALLRAVSAHGYLAPTPIQAAAIPATLQGRDVLGCAQTGSGKTAAFALPLLQHLESAPQHSPRRALVLVLVPTRELCTQVGEEIRKLALHLPRPLKVAMVFGGVSINPQMMRLRGGTDVVVATPGRLLDLVAHNALSLGSVATLVLDEADRLLDLGFAEELARILRCCPPNGKTCFSPPLFLRRCRPWRNQCCMSRCALRWRPHPRVCRTSRSVPLRWMPGGEPSCCAT
jgi:ATP-dependent RNA helicase RhlE